MSIGADTAAVPLSPTTRVGSDLATELIPCPSNTTNNILTSVVTAIITALLATLIFVLVQIAICKCNSKSTSGGAESAVSAEGEGQAEYKQVDASEGGVAENDHCYMEVGVRRGNILELTKNEAYNVFQA